MICGIYAALAISAAVRHRDATGEGSRVSLPLENVALSTAGNLGYLTEAAVTGTRRPRLGNSIYGQYGQHFTSSDGVSFMVVTLTPRHFRDLAAVTGTEGPWPRWPRRWARTSPSKATVTDIATPSPDCSPCGSVSTPGTKSPQR